jgi:tetratricopeptide (TPR) repeat protein
MRYVWLLRAIPIIIERMSEIRPREPILLRLYERYLGNRDTVGFVHTVSKSYTAGALERLACHSNREMRRAAVFSLGFVGEFEVNHAVGRAMQDDDRTVRLLAGVACRSVWNRAGDEDQRRQLADTIRLNAARQYRNATEKASALLDDAPWFAEAWYQRGAAWFQLDDFSQAIRDCHQALELNPYHFVAATAIGEAYLRLSNPVSALDAFRRALRLNPDLERVRSLVAELTRQVEDR